MDKKDVKKNNSFDRKKIKELEQEIEIKDGYITALEEEDQKPSKDYSDHGRRELEQENQMLNELVDSFEEKESTQSSENKKKSTVSCDKCGSLFPVNYKECPKCGY